MENAAPDLIPSLGGGRLTARTKGGIVFLTEDRKCRRCAGADRAQVLGVLLPELVGGGGEAHQRLCIALGETRRKLAPPLTDALGGVAGHLLHGAARALGTAP